MNLSLARQKYGWLGETLDLQVASELEAVLSVEYLTGGSAGLQVFSVRTKFNCRTSNWFQRIGFGKLMSKQSNMNGEQTRSLGVSPEEGKKRTSPS